MSQEDQRLSLCHSCRQATSRSPTIGMASLPGIRHNWNMLTGCLAADVLQWIREDPAFDTASGLWESFGVTFVGKGPTLWGEQLVSSKLTGFRWGSGACMGCKFRLDWGWPLAGRLVGNSLWETRPDFKTEFGRKWIKAGHLGGSCGTSSMCNLSLHKPIAIHRLQCWFRAWRWANGERCLAFQVCVPVFPFWLQQCLLEKSPGRLDSWPCASVALSVCVYCGNHRRLPRPRALS